MVENKGVMLKLDGFLWIRRLFKERMVQIRRWAGGFVKIFAFADGIVGDAGT